MSKFQRIASSLFRIKDYASTKKALQKLLRSPSALSRARSSLAYLPDMSRDSLRGFAQLGLLATLLQSFPKQSRQRGRYRHGGERRRSHSGTSFREEPR